ncbi:hypothetical protein OSTOST_19348, partial [Ostertagia ostertagi]
IRAGDRWFDQFLYSRRIKNVTPKVEDFATLPFFIMIKGDTPTVGCHVKLCDSTNGKNYAVLCYYGQPHVKVGEPLYKDGKPCSEVFGYHLQRSKETLQAKTEVVLLVIFSPENKEFCEAFCKAGLTLRNMLNHTIQCSR